MKPKFFFFKYHTLGSKYRDKSYKTVQIKTAKFFFLFHADHPPAPERERERERECVQRMHVHMKVFM